jgi:anti-sigma B factor antagonist
MASENDQIGVSTDAIADGVVVSLTGDIDFSCSPQLRADLKQVLLEEQSRLVLDLAQVGYMDSSGVAVLVEILQIQRKQEHKLVLCNMQDKVQKIFEISRLDSVFTIAADVAAAAEA